MPMGCGIKMASYAARHSQHSGGEGTPEEKKENKKRNRERKSDFFKEIFDPEESDGFFGPVLVGYIHDKETDEVERIYSRRYGKEQMWKFIVERPTAKFGLHILAKTFELNTQYDLERMVKDIHEGKERGLLWYWIDDDGHWMVARWLEGYESEARYISPDIRNLYLGKTGIKSIDKEIQNAQTYEVFQRKCDKFWKEVWEWITMRKYRKMQRKTRSSIGSESRERRRE